MVYSPVDPDTLLPGAKIIASLATKTRDNPLAVAAGDISVPIANQVDLGKALRTAETGAANVVKALAGGFVSWGAAPSIQVEQRTALGVGTWVVPAGVTQIEVQIWGGGGGYISIPSFPMFRSGNSGAHARAVLLVSPGETLTYYVGAGGPSFTVAPGNTVGEMSYIRNAPDTTYARAGGGGADTVVGVASAAGTYGAPLLLNGAIGKTSATQFPTSIQLPSPLAWNRYGTGGSASGSISPGQGYLQWRYVQP